MKIKTFYVVPAYKPSLEMLQIIKKLVKYPNSMTVVIDDGSGAEFFEIFSCVEKYENTKVIRHVENLGKGAALKTAFAHIIEKYENVDKSSIVTLDADGQHSFKDVMAVTEAAHKKPDFLILGSRSFKGAIPLRSMIGNKLTAGLLRNFFNIETYGDSQTGLRAIPQKFLKRALDIPGLKYDYETAFLLDAARQGVKIKSVPIDTIYHDNNASSNFKPIKDSLRIYSKLLEYGIVGIMSFVLEILLFIFIFGPLGIITANILSRVSSMAFNYILLRTFIFNSGTNSNWSAFKYIIIAIINALVGGLLINFISEFLSYLSFLNLAFTKAMVDLMFMIVNFYILRHIVFR